MSICAAVRRVRAGRQAAAAPHLSTELHVLDGVEERYLVTQGTGALELAGGEPARIGPGDFAYIPAGVAQRVTNTGADDLVFYCICTPAWSEGVYRSLE